MTEFTPPESTPISLVVFDMAGTTVQDTGLVERSFLAANEHTGLAADAAQRDEMMRYVAETMGQSKIVVFRHLSKGDESKAQAANEAFERSYAQLVAEGQCAPIPGAEEVLRSLRERGIRTALTTGFAQETQAAIIGALGWEDVADLILCPDSGMRGRPFPDMALTALMRTGTDSVRSMVTVGDTASDVQSGLRAGARASVGVLTGAHDHHHLDAAGATHILDSVRELPALISTLT